MANKRFNQITRVVTSFDSNDVLPVGNSTLGDGKVTGNTLLQLTAQKALADNVVEEFDPMRDASNPYFENEPVIINGMLVVFNQTHYGPMVWTHVMRKPSVDISAGVTHILPNKIAENKYLDSDGTLASDSHFNVYEYSVTAGRGIVLTTGTGGGYYGFFDENDDVVGTLNQTAGTDPYILRATHIVVPSNAVVLQVTCTTRQGRAPVLAVFNGEGDVALTKKFNSLSDEITKNAENNTAVKSAIDKIPASVLVPVTRTTKNLFSKDFVGNFCINRGDGKLTDISNIPSYKGAAIKLTAGSYVISGYSLFSQWCVGLWSLDFATRLGVKTDQYTSDPSGLISIPGGESWGSATQINITAPTDCYLLINLYNFDTLWEDCVLQVESGSTPTSYVDGVKLFPYYVRKNEIPNNSNRLANKKLLIVGDSITDSAKYVTSLINRTGCSVYNRGVSGSCIAKRAGSTSSFCERFDLAEDNTSTHTAGFPNRSNVDMVVVFGGTNDWGQSLPLGTISDEVDQFTFYGALRYLLDGLKTRYYGKPIVVLSLMNAARSTLFTSWNRVSFGADGSFTYRTNNAGAKMSDYRDATKDVCELLGVNYVDMFTCGFSPVCQYDYENLTLVQGDPAVPDGLHPNDAGGEIIARFINGKLNALM